MKKYRFLLKSSLLLIAMLVTLGACEQQNKNSESKSISVDESQKKILIVLTSNDKLGDTGNQTGYWIEELASPYYAFKKEGFDVVMASVNGGLSPFDPGSAAEGAINEEGKKFQNDEDAQNLVQNTVKLSDINPSDFDAVFYPGGHGLLWDLVNNSESISLIEYFNNSGQPVATVCHGPAVLANAKQKDGSPLVQGRKVTGFSDAEESAISLTEVVPFLLEEKFRESGADYSKGENWASYVVVDENLITGQNPASSSAVAVELIKKLKQ
ncbi:type 1 glutamine amidotransferase domain-containing protein [Aureibacter tunicatorum]|uniref:Intracellular protease/amidase n=1 Tax=Aureibacter tunicatorum TaxID=866807 RepID=A0AAE3XM82_9BACT|nr:type 1 glutamine amidotransferase domain-containing protein [Aureibacter tunicatorum]MDR6237529.1 putative intracellular protease/amidase [Aureibacter tunicatorum]BDD02563.1 dimethylallyltransferase [Aureibacter tunicatorum]